MPQFEPGHAKLGGRTAGTPNKASAALKTFFAEVVELAMADPAFQGNLVKAIVNLELDAPTFKLILEYAVGKPLADTGSGGSGALERLFASIVRPDAAPPGPVM